MGKKKNDNIDEEFEYYQIITPNGLEDLTKEKKEEIKKEEQKAKAEKKAAEAKPKHLYKYDGAIKYYNKIAIPYFNETTFAVSPQQAANNFRARAKKALNLDYNAGGVYLTKPVQFVR